MHLTIDFYEPEWHNHRIVCQCYDKGVPAASADEGYIERHVLLTDLERYIADVYDYTGQYYDSMLEEYFDKEDWDSVLYDLEMMVNKQEGKPAVMPRAVPCITPLPDLVAIVTALVA